jgi:two-component system, OmpR family, sensor kinase
VPIRIRLTAAFALALVLVLAGVAAFVFAQLRDDLDESVNESLSSRADATVALARDGSRARPRRAAASESLEDADESFSRVVAPGGRVVAALGAARGPVLDPDELERATTEPVVVERPVEGIEGTARVLARPVSAGGDGSTAVAVVGQSLDDRDEALSALVTSFAVGGVLAVVLASLIGYALATVGLRPVEAMRSRAASMSLEEDERLPLPAVHDEVRRLGETLNDMLDRLRSSFERERRFVADASHELRTPVAIVKTELEAALRMEDHGPATREALVAAIEECDHLAQLAEDLLVVARAADGRLAVRHERLDARSTLEGVRRRFADRVAHQGRSARTEAPAELSICADRMLLRQALGNLLDNSLRHGGGRVVLAARESVDGIELEVSDEGEGFAADVEGRAFERFARGDEARTRGGTGLGLAIVQAVAEAHGGRASILPGPGATVRLWLPRHSTPGGDGPDRDRPADMPGP